jgi:carbamoyl-phosphate synthase large subunit
MGNGPEYNLSTAAACRTLREMGNTVILLESHVTSLAADEHFADITYLEPLNRLTIETIYNREDPHRVFASVGGQQALNIALLLYQIPHGLHKPLTFFGNSGDFLEATQNKERFTRIVHSTGAKTPRAFAVNKAAQGMELGRQLGFPIVVRATLALSGIATAVTYNSDELQHALDVALATSAVGEAVVEKSLAGYKRTEWEVVRDVRDEVMIVGSVEYIEPLGIHSNDSPVVTPVQSLPATERNRVEHLVEQLMRNFKLTGTATVQLAHGSNPDDIHVVKITPRINTTSLWCARAAGIPIVEWHVRLSAGEPLSELYKKADDTIDLFNAEARQQEPQQSCWVRLPQFPGPRLMDSRELLTTYTKSVGSVTGVGPSFICALQKAVAAAGYAPLGPGYRAREYSESWENERLLAEITRPTMWRIWDMYSGLRAGIAVDTLHDITGIDTWFISQLVQLYELEQQWGSLQAKDLITSTEVKLEQLDNAKHMGCSDAQLAAAINLDESRLSAFREQQHLAPCPVDPVAGKTQAPTAVEYRTLCYGRDSGPGIQQDADVILIFGMVNSIIHRDSESEYIIAHAVREIHTRGKQSVLLSPNPLHLADEAGVPVRHYLEAVNVETVRAIIEHERPAGVILQFGERFTPDITALLKEMNVPILGTRIEHIERIRIRERFRIILQKLDVRQPAHGMAENAREAYMLADDIGYPIIVHPANPVNIPRIAIWYDQAEARQFLEQAPSLSELYPISIEKFLEDAKEFNVDGIADGTRLCVAGVIEYVEEAGVNSADSAAAWPVRTISPDILDKSREIASRIVEELNIRGIIGVKFAVRNDELFMIDLLPCVARSTVLLHKFTGCRFIPQAIQVLLGKSLDEIDCYEAAGNYRAVRAPVFPFTHFPGSSASLGPEKCSVGEAVGIDQSFGIAYAKALTAAGNLLPTKGNVLLAVSDRDKDYIIPIAKKLRFLGFGLLATAGTARELENIGVPFELVHKIHEGRPNAVDRIIDGDIQLIINTPGGKANRIAEAYMRQEAVERGILVITTIPGAYAAVSGIEAFMQHGFDVNPLEKYQHELRFQKEFRFEQQDSFDFDV